MAILCGNVLFLPPFYTNTNPHIFAILESPFHIGMYASWLYSLHFIAKPPPRACRLQQIYVLLTCAAPLEIVILFTGIKGFLYGDMCCEGDPLDKRHLFATGKLCITEKNWNLYLLLRPPGLFAHWAHMHHCLSVWQGRPYRVHEYTIVYRWLPPHRWMGKIVSFQWVFEFRKSDNYEGRYGQKRLRRQNLGLNFLKFPGGEPPDRI